MCQYAIEVKCEYEGFIATSVKDSHGTIFVETLKTCHAAVEPEVIIQYPKLTLGQTNVRAMPVVSIVSVGTTVFNPSLPPESSRITSIFSLAAAAAAWAACPINEGANTVPLRPARLIQPFPSKYFPTGGVEENRLLLAVFMVFLLVLLIRAGTQVAHKQMQHHAQSIFHVGPCRWDIRCPELFLKKTD